jgi:putative membrane protein
MNEVAMGGMMQLELSRVAAQKASNPQTKALAQAEITEQTGLAAKLKEIASAKGVTLPTSPDPQTKTILSKFSQASGTAFDKLYVTESGVKGHEKLNQVMTKVESNASDSNLKQLAKAAHPLVKTHLSVSRSIMTSM